VQFTTRDPWVALTGRPYSYVAHNPQGQPHGDESLTALTTSKVAVQTVEVSLDQLSMSWSDIVALVQGRLGKNIPSIRVGPFEKSVM
jgi:hypothetical protein